VAGGGRPRAAPRVSAAPREAARSAPRVRPGRTARRARRRPPARSKASVSDEEVASDRFAIRQRDHRIGSWFFQREIATVRFRRASGRSSIGLGNVRRVLAGAHDLTGSLPEEKKTKAASMPPFNSVHSRSSCAKYVAPKSSKRCTAMTGNHLSNVRSESIRCVDLAGPVLNDIAVRWVTRVDRSKARIKRRLFIPPALTFR
jgi:hypothetical protein